MKKFLFSLLIFMLSIALVAGITFADGDGDGDDDDDDDGDTGQWTLTKTTIDFTCDGGLIIQHIDEVHPDPAGGPGDFEGDGSQAPEFTLLWELIGNITGTNIIFTILNTAPGEGGDPTYNVVGVINESDGSVAGAVVTAVGDTNCTAFTMPAGSAILISSGGGGDDDEDDDDEDDDDEDDDDED